MPSDGAVPEPSVDDERPTKFFKRKQLFVEMDELDGGTWKEKRRWNFGLEEDLMYDGDDKPVWNHPHLPWVSVFGFMKLIEEAGSNPLSNRESARAAREH